MVRFRLAAACVILAAATSARAQDLAGQPADARPSSTDADAASQDVGVVWRNRPQIRIGKHTRIDVRARTQLDWRGFSPDVGENTFDVPAARFGVAGEYRNDVEFQVEYDTQKTHKWRDVYGEWKSYRQLTVRAGRFKMPFGLEQNTPLFDIDFAYRTLGSNAITPNRDTGVMALGRFHKRALSYEAGVFRHDGDNADPKLVTGVTVPDADLSGPSVAGRVTVLPLRWTKQPVLDTFRVGLAATASNVPEGLNSLHSDPRFGDQSFFKRVYVKGHRRRVGTELHWTPGPFGVSSEWMRAYEAREGQGFQDEDLPDLLSTSWYLAGTWVMTGERKEAANLHPAHPLGRGGWGAVEFGARYERLRFESATEEGYPERNPRGTNLYPNQDRVWTVGANWYLNRWVRLLGNAVHEHIDDSARTPVPPAQGYWTGLFRIQLAL